MNKIVYFLGTLLLALLFVQCEKEDIYDWYSPEILYKRYVQTQSGMEWQLSPDATEVTLAADETEFTVYARVSSPNSLKKITIYEVGNGGKETEVIVFKDGADGALHANPNEFPIAHTFTNITTTMVVRITAIDLKNHKTTRDFTIKK